jgi:hypothetical protein
MVLEKELFNFSNFWDKILIFDRVGWEWGGLGVSWSESVYALLIIGDAEM